MINLTYFIQEHFELKLAVVMWWVAFPILGAFLLWITQNSTVLTIYILLQTVAYLRIFWTELKVMHWFLYADIVCSPPGFKNNNAYTKEHLQLIGQWKDVEFFKHVR